VQEIAELVGQSAGFQKKMGLVGSGAGRIYQKQFILRYCPVPSLSQQPKPGTKCPAVTLAGSNLRASEICFVLAGASDEKTVRAEKPAVI
jgi:hypothetical protein